jgi:TolB-like protein/Tfp pilus assembly protein PilF
MGTVAYMSPEQAQGAALDERSDIFSFGAVFYELLSGNRAFEGASMAQILSAVLRDHPRPLNVAEPIARIVTRCLHKNPNDRFQTVADLRAALQQQLTPSAQTQLPQLAVSQSIAVLPFANIGADPENEYFSDGLAEEIINLLAHANDIRVIARTSAFAFKGQNTDIRRIAQTLGVTHVLEGGVRRAGGRVRITAQLISAADGSQIWSERYDRVLEDIFEVQDEIGQAIAGALHAKLSINSDSSNAVCRYEPNLPAYEAYLKGRHHASSTFTPESIELAQRHYQLALELDPQMALAHAGLAVLALMRAMLNVLPAHDAMRVVRSSARRALEIDPSLSEAHAILGVVAALYDYDWREAEHRFGMAMKPGPLSPVARGYYGYFYLMSLGRMPQAVEQLTIALKADPLNIQLRYQRAVTLLWNEQDEEAIAQLQQVLELHNQFPMAMTMMALAVVHSSQQKNTREALAWTQKGFPEVTAQLLPAAIQAGLFMRLGEPMNAQPFLDHLGDGHHHGAPAALAVYHLICGDTDQSANWIEKAIEERYPGVLFILQSPLAADLRTSPRWTGLVERMNLPQGDANSSRRNATS